jgi:hypothetical protein
MVAQIPDQVQDFQLTLSNWLTFEFNSGHLTDIFQENKYHTFVAQTSSFIVKLLSSNTSTYHILWASEYGCFYACSASQNTYPISHVLVVQK